jgi:hypothetical protein
MTVTMTMTMAVEGSGDHDDRGSEVSGGLMVVMRTMRTMTAAGQAEREVGRRTAAAAPVGRLGKGKRERERERENGMERKS